MVATRAIVWEGLAKVSGFSPAAVEVSPLVIDDVLSFPGARGDERSKVVKSARRTLAPDGRTEVSAGHALRALTTRRYYPGRYGVALQVNGIVHGRADVLVKES